MPVITALICAMMLSLALPSFAQSDPYPDDPEIPAAPATPSAGNVPAAPASPPSPAGPSKLWPADTVPVFMLSCAQFQREIVSVCRCIITSLMGTMQHNEFLALSETGQMENDPRYLNIRQRCLANAPKN